jgi:hypothetical protein
LPDASTNSALVNYLNNLMMHGQMSATLMGNINLQLAGMNSNTVTQRIQEAVYLIASSAEYWVERQGSS